MTTQSAIAGQSIGTGANVGDNKFSIAPLTLAAATTAYVVNVQLTNPSTGAAVTESRGIEVRVWYTTTMRTVTAANAPLTLGSTAHYVDIRPGSAAALVVSKDSALEPKTGSKFHCWVGAPAFVIAHTLDVDVVELPS